jgi:hypothetical protein
MVVQMYTTVYARRGVHVSAASSSAHSIKDRRECACTRRSLCKVRFSSAHSSAGVRCRLGVHVDVKSHSDATLYILYGESLMKYTGWYQNDFSVHGYCRR